MRGCFSAFLLVVFCVVVGCSRPMRIMVVGDFSGSTSALHVEGREGILWAIGDLSSVHKITYRIVNIHAMDEEQLKEQIRQYHPDILLGPFDSATAMKVIPLANALEMPVICPTVSSSLWSRQRDFMTRLVPENLQEIRSILYLMAEDAVTRPVLVYAEANEPYARAWVEEFTNFWQKRGQRYRVVSYHSSVKDALEAIVEEVVGWRPQALLLVTGGDEGGMIVQRVKGRWPGLSVYVSGWTMDRHFLRWSGKYGEGTKAIQHFVVSHTNALYRHLYDRFVSHYHQEPSFGFVYGYESVLLAVDLYKKSRGHLRKKWFSLFPLTFEGLQSSVYLDQYGDATRTLHIMMVVSNQWKVYDVK
ncbi:MAG: ABC transporter substrate-binding protein [Brevinematales bacterium]|nr:ABC transporter substrate-binding protein [Brevinematales bacterium]